MIYYIKTMVSYCFHNAWLSLLLFRHSAEKLNAQEEHLAASPQLVTRLHLPHTIELRLHVRKINVVILTPEMAGPLGV